MYFDLPDEFRAFACSIEDFARSELAPGAIERCLRPGFPRDLSRLFATKNLNGIVAGPVISARPHGVLAGVLAIEAVARICPRSADALHQGNFAASLLLARYAEGPRSRDELAGILAGDRLVAIAVSEEDAGSQATALSTRARMVDDHAVIDGDKRFTANSVEADAIILYVRFDDHIGDIGAVIVDNKGDDISAGDAVAFMNGELWRPLTFQNIIVPKSAILFYSGGFGDKASFFDLEKMGNAARALGIGWCAFDMARDHALQRHQFGRPLAEFQGLQWKLAETRLALEAAQLTLYRAASRADYQSLRGEDSSCAKLICNRAAMTACDLAVQVLGGTGYSQGHLAEYCFRKARGYLINGGVAELMLTRIAEGVFERRFPQELR